MLIHWSYVTIVLGLRGYHGLHTTPLLFFPLSGQGFTWFQLKNWWAKDCKDGKCQCGSNLCATAEMMRARLCLSEIREKKHDEKTWEDPDCRKKTQMGTSDDQQRGSNAHVYHGGYRICNWEAGILFTTLSFQLTDVGRMTPAMQKCCRRAQHRNNNKFSWRILAKQATAGAGEWSKHVEIEWDWDFKRCSSWRNHGFINFGNPWRIWSRGARNGKCQIAEVGHVWKGTVILETWHKDIVVYYINLYIYNVN